MALYKPTDVERYLSTVYELYKLVDLRSRGPRGTRDLTPKDRDGPIGCPPPARRFREALSASVFSSVDVCTASYLCAFFSSTDSTAYRVIARILARPMRMTERSLRWVRLDNPRSGLACGTALSETEKHCRCAGKGRDFRISLRNPCSAPQHRFISPRHC